MNALARINVMGFLAGLLLSATMAFAQDGTPVQDASYTAVNRDGQAVTLATQAELDQMLASIALYPDDLLTQILMASTYPLEVVMAARWSRDNPGLKGDQAVRAVDGQNWDPSVKSLVAFPQILQLMDGSLYWTERLGDVFLSQESDVWNSVQNLRQRADAAGNLQSNDQYVVQRDGPTYVIESPRPDIIYVPYYDPLVVYGPWWWPAYAPVRWAPWPGYYARPGYAGFYWGGGVTIGYGFFFGGVDWRVRHVNIINRNTFYYRNVDRRSPGNTWQHDPAHRRGVPYRNPNLNQQVGRPPAAPGTRDEYRGRTMPYPVQNPNQPGNPTNPNSGQRPPGNGFGPGNNRPDRPERTDRPETPRQPVSGNTPNPGPRPTYTPAVPNYTPAVPNYTPAVPTYTPGGPRPNAPQRYEPAPHILEGISNGREARDASARGQASYSRPQPMPRANTPQPQPAPQAAPRPAQPQAPAQPTQHGNAPANANRQHGEH